MEPFDKLTQNDKFFMANYITSFAGKDGDYTNQSVNPDKLNYILRYWNSEKSDLFKAFNNELILRKPMMMIKTSKELRYAMEDLLATLYVKDNMTFRQYYYDKIRAAFINGDFIDLDPITDPWYEHHNMVDDYRKSRLNTSQYRCETLVSAATLADNDIGGYSWRLYTTKDKKKHNFSAHMKAIKAIHKVCKMVGVEEEYFEKFRLAHSMVLNNSKYEGELCLSIHPIDYMTMSDNECGWESCMSWLLGGDYRQGTVEMMNSSCVVVAYVNSRSAEPVVRFSDNRNEITWPSKKWRELIICHKDVILGVKGYPCSSDELELAAMAWLKELMETAQVGSYEDDLADYEAKNGIISFNNQKENISIRNSFNFSFKHMYNDIYSIHPMYYNSEAIERYQQIPASGKSQCMCCGNDWDFYDNPDGLICEKCGGVIYYECELCGVNEPSDNMTSVDDILLCPHCYEYRTLFCDNCNEIHIEDNFENIYPMSDDNFIYSDTSICCCRNCITNEEVYSPIDGGLTLRFRPAITTTGRNLGYGVYMSTMTNGQFKDVFGCRKEDVFEDEVIECPDSSIRKIDF